MDESLIVDFRDEDERNIAMYEEDKDTRMERIRSCRTVGAALYEWGENAFVLFMFIVIVLWISGVLSAFARWIERH